MKVAVVLEKAKSGYSAYVPDLPGCVAAAKTFARVNKLIKEAIVFHLEGMQEDGEAPPKPSTLVGSVRVSLVNGRGSRKQASQFRETNDRSAG